MLTFFDQLVSDAATQAPDNPALIHKDSVFSYNELMSRVVKTAQGFSGLGLARGERVAVFLPKLPQTVMSLFATSLAHGAFVPVNSVLKPLQVQHILNDCDVSILVTSSDRLKGLKDVLYDCPSLRHIVLVDKLIDGDPSHYAVHHFDDLPLASLPQSNRVDADVAAILYTSGSTGRPKGVVLSHRNLLCGADSVSKYLENSADDVILALLPLSFDYGLSQITTAFKVTATCILMDYFLPGDVVKTITKHQVTGLAAVPPLWQQLMKVEWPMEATRQLRYFTNSGGAMPQVTLQKLRETFTHASPYLMYGLTEAFRSTYLPPELVDERPGSMGKAIPNAEIMVINEQGQECEPDEPGELVHRGPHVSLGYWNDAEKTAERFKPVPVARNGLMLTEMAVWSGDTVKKDKDGFLYFIGRKDEMIKTSGNRVSPMEVEEVCYQTVEEIAEVVVTGVPDLELGQAIVMTLVLKDSADIDHQALLGKIKRNLPNFMHPKHLEMFDALPRNPNGKVDRSALAKTMKEKYGNE